jgi:predicted MFS family arabinose efflux permease
MALLSAAFPPAERPRALGLFSGITGLALLGGPVVGGAIVEGVDWHWIFWLNVPIGIATLLLAHARIPESAGPRAAVDTPGLVLASASAFGAIWGLSNANLAGWSSFDALVPLAAGILLGLAFVAW